MPRYLIERTFVDHFALPHPGEDSQKCQTIIENNRLDGVTWLFTYVVSGCKKAYCLYEAPSPEAVRSASQHNGLPVDRITEVQVLDPYAFRIEPDEFQATGM